MLIDDVEVLHVPGVDISSHVSGENAHVHFSTAGYSAGQIVNITDASIAEYETPIEFREKLLSLAQLRREYDWTSVPGVLFGLGQGTNVRLARTNSIGTKYEAQSEAELLNASLVKLTTAESQQFVAETFAQTEDVWIAGYKTAGGRSAMWDPSTPMASVGFEVDAHGHVGPNGGSSEDSFMLYSQLGRNKGRVNDVAGNQRSLRGVIMVIDSPPRVEKIAITQKGRSVTINVIVEDENVEPLVVQNRRGQQD